MENSATHQIDKTSLCIRVDMNMCTNWYHQHKYRHFGMDYSNTHWYLKINKKLKLRELSMIMTGCLKWEVFKVQNSGLSLGRGNQKHVSRPISLPFWFFAFNFLLLWRDPRNEVPGSTLTKIWNWWHHCQTSRRDQKPRENPNLKQRNA